MPANLLLKDLRSSYAQLNPNEVHHLSRREISIGLVADSEAGIAALEEFFAPETPVAKAALERMPAEHQQAIYDFIVCAGNVVCPAGGIFLSPGDPARTINEILDAYPDLEIPLARHFVPFREPVITRIIHRTSKENALFSMLTALPNIAPNLLELPWAVGEFATDTAFLTMNQVRMAFLIAAANGKPVGYGAQKIELATIVAGAFGWRSIARELAGKIPLGGGLIPKAAISFAGTYVVGMSLERLHRTGYGLKRGERRQLYGHAFERGKGIVGNLVSTIRKKNAA